MEGAWVAAGQVVTAAGALASIRIMTELLSPAEFGHLTLLIGIAALALGLTVTPRLQAIVRYYPDWALARRIGTLRHVSAGLVAWPTAAVAIVVAGGWLVASSLFGGIWYAGLLVAALMIVDGLRSFELSLLGAARRQRVAAVIYAADAWARPTMAIVTVFVLGATANSALGGYVAGSLLVVVLLYATTRLEGNERDLPGPSDPPSGLVNASQASLAKAIRHYAQPLVPLALFGWFSGVGDRYVVGGLLGLEQVGVYAAVYALVSRPFLMLSTVIELTIRPVLQNAISVGNLALVNRTKLSFILAVGGGGAIGMLGFLLLSRWVAGLFLAEEYRYAAELMPWIALGYTFYTISNVFSRFCYAFDDTTALLILTVAGTLIGAIAMVPAIMVFGLYGAAVAVPVRFGVELVLSIFLAGRSERRFFAGTNPLNESQQ